jgi:uncharacterized integral membrane protein
MPPTGGSSRKTPLGASPRLIAGIVLAALAIWFVLINTSTARIHFWFFWAQAPMWFVLAVTFAAGVATAMLLARRKK